MTMATGYVRTDNSSVIDGLKQENAALLERLQQCDRAIQRIASHVGAVCGGVDVMDDNGLGSHTSEEIIRKIEAIRQEAVPECIRNFLSEQVGLPEDMKQVLYDNLWDLYESAAPTREDE